MTVAVIERNAQSCFDSSVVIGDQQTLEAYRFGLVGRLDRTTETLREQVTERTGNSPRVVDLCPLHLALLALLAGELSAGPLLNRQHLVNQHRHLLWVQVVGETLRD